MPVTAVHAMIHPPGIGEPERNSAGWTVENQSRWNREDNSKHARQDVIARGLLYEDEARHLFDIFMHGGNVFFPVFDPFLDTFDSVRQRSAFTLTVVLYIAARHEYIHSPGNHTLQVCMEEARRFAADSLFENPSSLETTEAMALLAVHSDTTWFALGHAHQMAMDLGLDTKLRSFISNSGSTPTKPQATKTMRYAFRCSRLLLLIAQYERALAFGTIRRTRIEHFRFEDMERFLNNAHSHPSAVFPCAAIDLWQCLTRLRASIDTLSIDDVERETKTWFDKWDSLLEDNSIHQGSFQRSHLMLQYHYSRIILSAILLVSMIKSRGTSQLQSPLAVQQRVSVSTRILQLVRDLLAAIEDCTVFKRVFSWAPTYDGLILTFAIILGFQILQFVPDPVQETALLEQVEQTNKLLKKHPCQNFYAVVKRLIHGAKSSKANSASTLNQNLDENWPYDVIDYTSILQGEDWVFDIGNCVFFDPDRFADTDIA